MMEKMYDLVIAGGGPAGMAAAVQAHREGVNRILLVERNSYLGGMLPQCIHDGFGLEEFGMTMTGPEYAHRWIWMIETAEIEYLVDAAVIDASCGNEEIVEPDASMEPGKRERRDIEKIYDLKISSPGRGVETVRCRALILASGCRERSRGQLRIPGSRPAGVYTAGAVQYMMNIQNYLPGKSAVILGSGDIGLIMARRMKWEGIDVKMILGEKASGLLRNYIQCVKDWKIPIRFSHTVVKIHGRKRITGVTVAPVFADGTPDLKKSQYIRCDLLVIAAGLIPETEIWNKIYASEGKEPCAIETKDEIFTQRRGVFVCGNVVRQYDTVDEVSVSGRRAGQAAAAYLKCSMEDMDDFSKQQMTDGALKPSDADTKHQRKPEIITQKMYTKHVMTEKDMEYLSSDEPLNGNEEEIIYCICCPKGCRIEVCRKQEKNTASDDAPEEPYLISGFGCPTGKAHALQEMTAPKRMVTATIAAKNQESILIPVKTSIPVDKKDVARVMKACRKIRAELPVTAGQMIQRDVLRQHESTEVVRQSCGNGKDFVCKEDFSSGVDLIACADVKAPDTPESWSGREYREERTQ